MRLILFSIFISVSLMLVSCEEGETTVGSNQDTLIPNLSFTVDTTYLDSPNSKLVAKGVVSNNGNAQVTSPWYIECQFYANSTRTTKLGGNYTQIGVPLSNGQSTFWTITYSSTNVNVNDYPDFAISDLRGIYK